MASVLPAPGAARRRVLAVLLVVAALGCPSSVDPRLDAARALVEEGRYGEAIEALGPVLVEHPEDAEANHLLGVCYAMTGHVGLAVAPLEKAARSAKLAIPAGILLASSRLRANDAEGAVEAASRVLEIDPARSAALYTRGQASLAANRPEATLADAERMLALRPDAENGFLLRAAALCALERWADCEAAYQGLREAAADGPPAAAARACLALASFYADRRGDAARARRVVDDCLEARPADPLALSWASQLYDRLEEPAAATAAWRRAVEREPSQLALRAGLATRLVAEGKAGEAQGVLVEAAEREPSAAAWLLLANFQRQLGDAPAALRATGQALERLPEAEAEPVRFQRAELLVDSGDLAGAEALLPALAVPAHREFARGRILLARGQADAALAAFEVALQADPAATDAALVLARQYLARGRFAEAVRMAQQQAAVRPLSGIEAHLVTVRALAASGQLEAARTTLDQLAKLRPLGTGGVLTRAWVERRAAGPAAAVDVVDASGLDLSTPAGQPVLRSLVGDLVALGRSDEALARVREARARRPGDAGLESLEGSVLLQAGRTDAARGSFERVLARDARNAVALAGLAEIAAHRGDVATALARWDAATAADPANTAPSYRAAQLLLERGRTDEARARLRDVVHRDPGNAFACNDLAYLLADAGEELELAAELAERAARLAPTAEILDTRGWVALRSGQLEPAIHAFERALALDPQLAGAWYHLGLARVQQGQRDAALEAFRKALAAGPSSHAEAARAEMARLAER